MSVQTQNQDLMAGLRQLLRDFFDTTKFRIPVELQGKLDNMLNRIVDNIGTYVIEYTGGEKISIDLIAIRNSLLNLQVKFEEMCNPTQPKVYMLQQFTIIKEFDSEILHSWIKTAYKDPHSPDCIVALYEVILKIINQIDHLAAIIRRPVKQFELDADSLRAELVKVNFAISSILTHIRILTEKAQPCPTLPKP